MFFLLRLLGSLSGLNVLIAIAFLKEDASVREVGVTATLIAKKFPFKSNPSQRGEK